LDSPELLNRGGDISAIRLSPGGLASIYLYEKSEVCKIVPSFKTRCRGCQGILINTEVNIETWSSEMKNGGQQLANIIGICV